MREGDGTEGRDGGIGAGNKIVHEGGPAGFLLQRDTADREAGASGGESREIRVLTQIHLHHIAGAHRGRESHVIDEDGGVLRRRDNLERQLAGDAPQVPRNVDHLLFAAGRDVHEREHRDDRGGVGGRSEVDEQGIVVAEVADALGDEGQGSGGGGDVEVIVRP